MTTSETIAVTGAAGQLGRLVIADLLTIAPGARLSGLVRNPSASKDLADRGVRLRAANYDDPASLRAALFGADKLLLISSSEIGKRAAQHRNVIEAAKVAGVKFIAYTSILHADTSPMELAKEHRETEALIHASGVPFAILRNGWYTENYTGSIPGALAGGAFLGSAGEGKISSATRTDYAEAAVAVLTGEGQAGKVYELAGDKSSTLADLAAEISRQTGKTIPYKNLSEADYAAALASVGLPGGLASAIAGWDAAAAKGALFEDGGQLARLIGRPTTPLSTAVSDALKL